MAESAVTFLLNKLANLIHNEVQQLKGGWEEIVSLKYELENIRAFLRDADTQEESDDEIKTWVKQVRDVSHDAEDVVDEFTLLSEHDHHGEGLYGCLHKLCNCVRNVKARYRLTFELRCINSRITSLFAARRRLVPMLNMAREGSSLINSGNAWRDRRDDALLLDNIDLVGMDGPKRQLIRWLVDGDSERRVVAVSGMGGMGKTALVKNVYDDADVKKHFNAHVWITVSQSFNQKELLKDLIQSLSSVIRRSVRDEGVDNMSIVEMKILVENLLRKRRYLVVLDDVWNLHEWESIKHALPNSSIGSRVMLTTRRADLASTAASSEFKGEVYNLMPLDKGESWNLFCRKAFRGDSCPSYLFKICDSILKKCEGLPLAIVALSGVLATKDKLRIDDWDAVRRSLGAEIHGNDKLEDLKRVLFLSFNDLPYYLKSCFLYLSIFPKGPFKRMKVIRLWIAEGFIEAKEGRTLEEVAQYYLDELLNRSLIQVATTKTDGRIKAYRVHNLLREIIISKSRDQNFAAIVKAPNTAWPNRARRLSVHSTLPTVRQNRSVYQLRSLFLFGVVEKSSLGKYFQLGFKLLRVLDMEAAPIKMFPIEIVDLFFLRHLSLRKTKVKTIPRSIGKLRNLETFDLKHTMVSELPIDILKLQKLRHLLVYRFETNVSYAHFYSESGFKAFSGIGGLQSLQQLCFIEADQACGTVMSELRELSQLRRLGIIKLRKLDGPALCSSIEKLSNLRMLSIKSTEENEEIDLQRLSSPPRLLERLYLTGRLEELPSWIPSLHCLVKLSLKWSRLKTDPLLLLQDLPSLVHLELLQAYDRETLHFKAGKFKKLKLLGLDKFDNLKHVKVGKGAMPCLEKLVIQRCNLLKRVPSGVERLTELKVIEFFDMPDELIMKLCPDGEGEDHWKVAHVPEVYSTYWRDGGWDVYSIEGFKEREKSPPTGKVRRSHRRRSLWKA